MNKNSRIYVAGHTGLVGHNLLDELIKRGYHNLFYATHRDIDLVNSFDIETVFSSFKPEYVFLCAARVGGIQGNDLYSADFIYENTMIQSNVIKACHDFKVKKLLFLGTSCIYPMNAPIPIKEKSLLTGLLEQTNIGYSIAKINGLIMCQMFNKQYGDNFISVMPSNLYGKYDNYNPLTSHAFSSLLRKIHEAKLNNKPSITIWGSGNPLRELLFTEDLTSALIFLMKNYNSNQIINIGTGVDISILNLTKLTQFYP